MYKKIKGEDYPVEHLHFIRQIDGVDIIHLNTSWLCGMNGEEGHLFIGTNKLFDSLSGTGITPGNLTIAIGHHSFDCLHKKEQGQLGSLFKDHHIDIYLSGHVHQALINYDSHIDTHFCVCRQMKSDSYDSGGFAIGSIDTENENNYIEFHTWKQIGYWTFDNDVGPQAPKGVYTLNSPKFPCSKLKEKPIIVIHKAMGTPVNQKKLLNDMGFGCVPVYQYPYSNLEISTHEEWLEHKDNTIDFTNSFISRLKDNNIHIFPLSQIPLLICMGYGLQDDNNNITVYQFSDNQQWVSDSSEAECISMADVFIENNPATRKLVVVVEVSSNIIFADIDAHISTTDNSVLHFTIGEPERFKALYSIQVREIKNKFRKVTERYIINYDEIHLFCAVPAGLAVEMGRCILKSMWPIVYLYNFRRGNTPRYQLAFDIN